MTRPVEKTMTQMRMYYISGMFNHFGDFNKYITVARRYTTKIHGVAATKQSDFRDWPWFSIDSTTWKSSERYGTLIHWDEHRQKLIFEEDKSQRAKYRAYFEKYHLDAQGIIKDTNYREVTKYALISMSEMEKFYQRKYSTRTFYYELRLDHPLVLKNSAPSVVQAWWTRLKLDELLKSHQNQNVLQMRRILTWLSGIQYREAAFLTDPSLEPFVREYLPAVQNLSDLQALQKEVSSFIAPVNPLALTRALPEDFAPTNNAPKKRIDEPIDLEDLEVDASCPFSLEDLEY